MITLGGYSPATGLVKFILIGSIDDRKFLTQTIREQNTKSSQKVEDCIVEITENTYKLIKEQTAENVYFLNDQDSFEYKIKPLLS